MKESHVTGIFLQKFLQGGKNRYSFFYARLTKALEENHYNRELLELYDAIGLTNKVVDKFDEAAEKEWKAYDEYLIFMTGHGMDEQPMFSEL